jgi:hypothetical protein
MSNQLLPDFTLHPTDYGWTGKFPGGPHQLFGKEILVQIDTRSVPDRPKDLPPLSPTQASLVRTIAADIHTVLKRVEAEMIAYNQSFDPDFQDYIKDPQVWLKPKEDDGETWAFVVERTDNSDFGYHAEFKGTKFIELWAGD